jgi:hypothetical protein
MRLDVMDTSCGEAVRSDALGEQEVRMRWLITVRKSTDLARLTRVIRACGGEPLQDAPPVPLGDAEIVLQASGSAELPEALKADADVIDVYPDSEMELYRAQ